MVEIIVKKQKCTLTDNDGIYNEVIMCNTQIIGE